MSDVDIVTALYYDICYAAENCKSCVSVRDRAADEIKALRSKLEALQTEPTYRIRQQQAERIQDLESRLEQLQSQREVDASLDAKLTDNVRGHWERRIKELESRLDAIREWLGEGRWNTIINGIEQRVVERGSRES